MSVINEHWIAAMKAKGHSPIMNDGDLDAFVVDVGFHNGPGCSVCNWSCCMHCEDVDSIPDCTVIEGAVIEAEPVVPIEAYHADVKTYLESTPTHASWLYERFVLGKPRTDDGPAIMAVDLAKDDTETTVLARHDSDGTITILDIQENKRGPVIWVDECRDIPPEVLARAAEAMKRIKEDMEVALITGPISSHMRDADPYRFMWPPRITDFELPRKPAVSTRAALRRAIISLGDMTTTTTPTPRIPTTPSDLDRLRKAEEKRARKAAKRRREA